MKHSFSAFVLLGLLAAGCHGDNREAHRGAGLRPHSAMPLPPGRSGAANGIANGAQLGTPGATVGPGSGAMGGANSGAAGVGTAGGGQVGGR